MQQTVLITGGASGIGRHLAERLAQTGYRVWVSDVSEEKANLTATAIQEQGFQARGVALNMAKSDGFDAVLEHIGNIDIVINNAGIQHVEPLDSYPLAQWQLLHDVMLTGPAMLCKAVLPQMRSRNFGRIVNIGSIHALVASKYKSAYVAAKHGLMGLSKVLALETAQHDITVNTICPAYVKTPLVEQQIASQAKEHGISEQEVIEKIMLAPMPKKAFIELEEIFHSVQFLIAPAARNVTGQAIVIDGGWTVQ
ncbi:D-beta-hydroxybutyrate dehydrogenase [Pseudoalteromonas luteoviolacea B = ATCC 29581]|nr:D-beta-hydroxybutyrate dehydrogenase [Pseudoalteromonas luteoviolacea B = ATCC 29581]